jgi:hypothetical protein
LKTRIVERKKGMKRLILQLVTGIFCLSSGFMYAGNPDRQGEAGGYELLLNPWARSAGLHALNTSMVSGVEAMQINIAGLSRINKTEFIIAHTRLYEGTGIQLNSLGLAQKMGENGAWDIPYSNGFWGYRSHYNCCSGRYRCNL